MPFNIVTPRIVPAAKRNIKPLRNYNETKITCIINQLKLSIYVIPSYPDYAILAALHMRCSSSSSPRNRAEEDDVPPPYARLCMTIMPSSAA
ncbi:hypothetical protein [Sphingobium olei]|uniref:Uncharacterized protein n=1 Tax=Sphingobium olei TaxID=420955 RepID=A0ABW3P8P7_9SPHN|nr:hypothetical protein [Sphingobium sp.]